MFDEETLAKLYTMPQDEVIAYLESLNPGSLDPMYKTPGYATGWDGVAEGPSNPTGYWQPLTPAFDPQYAGGEYGQYIGNYDPQGNFQGVDFQKAERSNGFFGDNMDILGPLLVAAFAGGATLFANGGLTSAGTTIKNAIAQAMGPGTTFEQGVAYMTANGIPAAEAAELMAAAATDITTGVVASAAGSTLPAWAGEALVAKYGAEAAGNLINGFGSIPGVNSLPAAPGNTPSTPGATPSTPGSTPNLPNIPGGWGDAVKSLGGLFGLDASENNIDKMYALGERSLAEGKDMRDWVMQNSKEFTPYNVTTNTGKVTTGPDGTVNANLNPALKGTIDKATGVANKMFTNAQNFDYDQNALQEYNLMMGIMEPQREQQWNTMESRAAAQGRLGLASYADGNSVTGPNGEIYGTSPEMIAWQKAMRDQELKTLLAARSTGLERQGSMINQGNAAMQPATAGAAMEQNMLGTSGQFGNNAATTWNNNLRTAVAPWYQGQQDSMDASKAALTANTANQTSMFNTGANLLSRWFS
jgi:hypothetical protein